MNASVVQLGVFSRSSNSAAVGAVQTTVTQQDLVKQARAIACPMALARFAVTATQRVVPFRKAVLFVDGAVRSIRVDTQASRSSRVVAAIEVLAASLVNQQLDTACVIDRCLDFVNDSSKIVALYDFYPQQMLWIPWRSGTGRNAKVVGGLLLERQQQWSISDIAALHKLVAVYAQTFDAMAAGFPPPPRPSRLAGLRLALCSGVFVFSLLLASLSVALVSSPVAEPVTDRVLFSAEQADSEFDSYI